MIMDAAARTLVEQLVAALGPLTNCGMTRMVDPPRLPGEVDSRLIPLEAYDAADQAAAAARAALASAASP